MPRGCKEQTPIAELAESNTLCWELSPAQWEIIKTLAHWWPNLIVTAPTWNADLPLTSNRPPENSHHFATNAMDFGCPKNPADLLKAFLTLKEFWGGGLGLGLSGGPKQYGAQIHLHVDGRMGDGNYRRWFETAIQYPAGGGFLLTQHTINDEALQTYFRKDLPGGAKQASYFKKKGLWDQTLADARAIYGYYGGPDKAIVDEVKNLGNEGSADPGAAPWLGAAIGAALGYDRKDMARTVLYALGGYAAGVVIGKLGGIVSKTESRIQKVEQAVTGK